MSGYYMADMEYEFERRPHRGRAVISATDEMDLAAELLEVQSDEEMEMFLGSLIRKASGYAKSFASSSTGRALGGILKDAARDALPKAGGVIAGAIGNKIGGQTGADILTPAGRVAGQKLGEKLGLELEGLSPEDQEFEAAKRFVRFAAEATKKASQTARRSNPVAVARAAANVAARKYAPGILQRVSASRGIWQRRGSTIVVQGV